MDAFTCDDDNPKGTKAVVPVTHPIVPGFLVESSTYPKLPVTYPTPSIG